MSVLTPPCPNCGKAVPATLALWGLGKPFACKRCGTELIVDRNYWIAFSAVAAFFLIKPQMNGGGQIALLFIGLAVAVLVLSRLFLKPRRAEARELSDLRR